MSETTILALGCSVTLIAAYGAYIYCHDLFGGESEREERPLRAEPSRVQPL